MTKVFIMFLKLLSTTLSTYIFFDNASVVSSFHHYCFEVFLWVQNSYHVLFETLGNPSYF